MCTTATVYECCALCCSYYYSVLNSSDFYNLKLLNLPCDDDDDDDEDNDDDNDDLFFSLRIGPSTKQKLGCERGVIEAAVPTAIVFKNSFSYHY